MDTVFCLLLCSEFLCAWSVSYPRCHLVVIALYLWDTGYKKAGSMGIADPYFMFLSHVFHFMLICLHKLHPGTLQYKGSTVLSKSALY